MPSSSFFGLNIAYSGMQTYQAALNVTAHNVANVNTTGYSRQTANQSANAPIRTQVPYGMIGTGAQVTSITQSRSVYYDKKYWASCSTNAKYSSQSYYLTSLEKFLYTKDKDDGGITTSFDNFYTTLTSLSSDVTDESKLQQVVSYASTFTDFITSTAKDVQKLQEESNFEIKTTIDSINSLSEQICAVTQQINTLETYGDHANDLRDQRNVLIDNLSEYVNVSVDEVTDENGFTSQYMVHVNGSLLVDTDEYHTLTYKQRENKENLTDVDGLYDVSWDNGVAIKTNAQIGGKLQALFEVRDGNNATTFNGDLGSVTKDASGKLQLVLKNTTVNDVTELNIASNDGTLTIEGMDYGYESFNVAVGADGNFTYTFELKEITSVKQAALENAVDRGSSASVGDEVKFKGVPYYMAQLNKFVRQFSQEFNEVCNQGYDSEGNQGLDFFNSKQATSGNNYIFTEKGDGYDASFSSKPTMDADGNYIGSYYYMDCLNFSVNTTIQDDYKKIPVHSTATAGAAENDNLKKLMALKDDKTMFTHGAPDAFLQTMVASLGVDSKRANTMASSQSKITQTIESQRLSVSGVDEDEEGADLVKYQNLLFNQYKVLSVMDEVFDKLINGTAV